MPRDIELILIAAFLKAMAGAKDARATISCTECAPMMYGIGLRQYSMTCS